MTRHGQHFAFAHHPDNRSEKWGAPTLLHRLVEEEGIREHPHVRLIDRGTHDHGIPDPGSGAPADYYARVRARCPACGRDENWTWTLMDVRSLPEEVTGGIAFACDGCWSQWIRKGRITAAEIVALHGAPEPHVRRVGREDVRFGREPKVPEHVTLPPDLTDRMQRAADAKRVGVLSPRRDLEAGP